MSEFVYVLRLARPDMLSSGPTPREQEIVGRHFAHLQRLVAQGTALFVGRTQTTDPGTFGLVVLKAADLAAAESLAASDPAVKDGVMRAEVRPFKTVLLAEEWRPAA